MFNIAEKYLIDSYTISFYNITSEASFKLIFESL